MASVLITGGTGGLGVAVVEAFKAAGWRVVVTYIVEGDQERLPDGVEAVYADLSDPDDVGRAVRVAASDDQQPLKAVANLVGGFKDGQPVAETPPSDFEAMLELNLRPTYLVTQAALPRLVAAGGGAIRGAAGRATRPPRRRSPPSPERSPRSTTASAAT
jgi:NAD(P)-dependent dehydrogenase (short-subunit alcohol dehydrogenase family)